MNLVREYDATIDSKKRFVLRSPKYKNYHVKEYKDGQVVLEPRLLVRPELVSKRTLKMMDKSMKNFKKGKVGKPIDLKNAPNID